MRRFSENEVVIIGSGVAGMSCSLYLQRAGINTIILGDMAGSSLVGSPIVKNYPGIENINGADLLLALQNQICFSSKISGRNEFLCDCVKLQITENGFLIYLENREEPIFAKAVIVASGRRPKMLGIPNEQELLGNGISTCVYCDGDLYEGKNIAIVGGGNSAVEGAIYLARMAEHVDLIVRKDHLRSELPLSTLESLQNVSVKFNTEIREIARMKDRLSVTFKSDGSKCELYDGVFYAIGQTPNSEFLPNELKDENGYVKIAQNHIPKGCFFAMAGDVSSENLHKQAVTAAADGAAKALDFIEWRCGRF